MFMYVYFIQPYKEMSVFFNTPINAFEPFSALANNEFFLPLVAITYMILICDQPRLDDSATFILFRTGRSSWILGQIFFLVASSLTFILFLLFSSMLTVSKKSYVINAWGLISRKSISPSYYPELALKYPYAIIDGSVINNVRPFMCVIHAICLMLMFMLVVGLIMVIFTLYSKKIYAVFFNLTFVAAGLILSYIDVKAKWLLPISNCAFKLHYDKLFDKTLVSIEFSYLYFSILCTILIIFCFVLSNRCSFHMVGGTE